jgi:hypothetical protein
MNLPMKGDKPATDPNESLRKKWSWQDEAKLATPVKMTLEEMAVFADDLFHRACGLRLSDRKVYTPEWAMFHITFAEARKLASMKIALDLLWRHRADDWLKAKIAAQKAAEKAAEKSTPETETGD